MTAKNHRLSWHCRFKWKICGTNSINKNGWVTGGPTLSGYEQYIWRLEQKHGAIYNVKLMHLPCPCHLPAQCVPTPLTNTAHFWEWWRNHLRRRAQQVTHWFMASYALSTVPLISTLQAEHPERSEADLVVPTIQAEVTAPHMMGHHEQFWSILGMMSINRPKPTLFSVKPEVCWASTRDLHWNSSTHYDWRSTLPWKHVGRTSIVEALFIAKWTCTHGVQNWRVLQGLHNRSLNRLIQL